MIKVYSTKACGQCRVFKNWMVTQKIPFEEVYIDDNEELKNKFDSMNMRSLPIVEVDGKYSVGIISSLQTFVKENICCNEK